MATALRLEHTAKENPFPERRRVALNRCDVRIAWYSTYARRAWMWWYTLQIATIALGGLTPLLILVTDLPGLLKALPSALAVGAASINGMYRSRTDAIRYAYARDRLGSERAHYETRTGSYCITLGDERALDRFVRRSEEITIKEISEWREDHMSSLLKTNTEMDASGYGGNGATGKAASSAQ
jgi:hypothetical protein